MTNAKMLLKIEKAKPMQDFEELWQSIAEHMKNPDYAKTAKFTHKHLAGKL